MRCNTHSIRPCPPPSLTVRTVVPRCWLLLQGAKGRRRRGGQRHSVRCWVLARGDAVWRGTLLWLNQARLALSSPADALIKVWAGLCCQFTAAWPLAAAASVCWLVPARAQIQAIGHQTPKRPQEHKRKACTPHCCCAKQLTPPGASRLCRKAAQRPDKCKECAAPATTHTQQCGAHALPSAADINPVGACLVVPVSLTRAG